MTSTAVPSNLSRLKMTRLLNAIAHPKKPEIAERLAGLSYRDFHAKGMDYVCLARGENGHTLKVYFIEGNADEMPEVVNPHDHRYWFTTWTLAGQLVDYRFVRDDRGEVFNRFSYMTPLNGGNGFTYEKQERLLKTQGVKVPRGWQLSTSATDLHTISAFKTGTVIMLEQFPDVVPVDKPTTCWSRGNEPQIDTSGLYREMDMDHYLMRLAQLKELITRMPVGQGVGMCR